MHDGIGSSLKKAPLSVNRFNFYETVVDGLTYSLYNLYLNLNLAVFEIHQRGNCFSFVR